MQFEVFYRFMVEAVPPRKRNARKYGFPQTRPLVVDVPEADPKDFPLAFEVITVDGLGRDGGRSIYLYQDCLWEQVDSAYGNEREGLTVNKLPRYLQYKDRTYIKDAEDEADYVPRLSGVVEMGERFDPSQFASIVANEEEEVRAGIQQAASGYLIVGKYVYERTSEPRYRVETHRSIGGDSAWVTVVNDYDARTPREKYFSALQYVEAQEAAKASVRADREGRWWVSERIRVHIPGIVKCDPQGDGVEKTDFTIRFNIEGHGAARAA